MSQNDLTNTQKQQVKPTRTKEEREKRKAFFREKYSKDKSSSSVVTDSVADTVSVLDTISEADSEVTDFSISDWTRKWVHYVPNCLPSAIAQLKSLGLNVQGKDYTTKGHVVSAVCRDQCVLRMFYEEGTGKTSLNVLDYFGANRNNKFKPKSFEINMINHSPLDIQGDSYKRSPHSDPLKDFLDYKKFDIDCVLMQDVYWHGKERLSSKHIKFCLENGWNSVYVMFRPFVGDMGWDEPYEGKVEGFWYREDDMIYFQPEEGDIYYPAHYDLNWLLTYHVDGMDVKLITVCGPFRLVKLTLGVDGAIPIEPQKLFDPVVETFHMDGKGESFKYWMLSTIDKCYNIISSSDYFKRWMLAVEQDYSKTMLVHLPTKAALAHFKYKILTGYNLDSVLGLVKQQFNKDLAWLNVRKPELYEKLLDGTALACMFYSKKESAGVLTYLKEVYEKPNGDLAVVRNNKEIQLVKNFWLPKVMLGVGLIGLGWTAYRKLLSLSKDRVIGVAWVGNTFDKGSDLLKKFVGIFSYEPLITGPLFEETLRYFMGKYFMLYAAWEAVLHLRETDHGVLSRVAPFLMHGALCYLPFSFKVKLLMHIVHNAFWILLHFQKNEVRSYGNFVSNYIQGVPVKCGRPWMMNLINGFCLPGVEAKRVTPREIKGFIKVQYCGVDVDPFEVQAMEPYSNPSYVYPLLCSHRVLWAPNNSLNNLMAALLLRLHKYPKYFKTKRKDLRIVWRNVFNLLKEQGFFLVSEEKKDFFECVADMGKKARRIIQAKERNELGAEPFKKTVMVKADETLPADKEVEENVFSIKPRILINLDPVYHAITTTSAKNCFEELKNKTLDGFEISITTKKGFKVMVKIFIGSGRTAKQLSEIGEKMMAYNGISCVFSGDDGTICAGDYSDFLGFERCDFDISMADQSVYEEVHDELLYPYLLEMHTEKEVVDIVKQEEEANYSYNKRELKIKGNPGVILNTGKTNTTSFNTLNSSGIVIGFLQNYEEGLTLENYAASLGVQAKVEKRRSFHELTFLKGWWMPKVNGGLVWLPLPSLLIKLGKISRDPHTLYPNSSHSDSYKKVLYSISKCMGESFPLDYPILGDYIRNCSRLSIEGEILEVRENYNKPTYDNDVFIDSSVVYESLEGRYGITKLECDEFARQLDAIVRVPTIYGNPLVDKLCEVDYGGDLFLDTVVNGESIIPNLMSLVPYTNNSSSRTSYAGSIANFLRSQQGQAISRAVIKRVVSMASSAGSSGGQNRNIRSIVDKPVSNSKVVKERREKVYTAPVNVGYKSLSKGPRTSQIKGGGVRVSNKELVSDSVVGYANFTKVVSYDLNPGLENSFPWLSTIAGSYEQYRFKRLRYTYVPVSSTANSGDIIISADYNSQENPPANEAAAINRPGSLTTPVWVEGGLSLKPNLMYALGPRKYVRSGASAGDIKTFDSGKVSIFANNCTDTTHVMGKIFVEYEVEFYYPQMNTNTVTPTTLASFRMSSDFSIAASTTTGIENWGPDIANAGNLGCIYHGSGVFYVPVGVWKIQASMFISDSVSENKTWSMTLKVNGAAAFVQPSITMTGQNQTFAQTWILDLPEETSLLLNQPNGTADIEIFLWSNGTGTLKALAGSTLILTPA